MTGESAGRPAMRRVLVLVFYLLLGSFLVYYLRDLDWETLFRLSFQPLYLFLALPASLVPRFLQPLAWGALLRDFGSDPPSYPWLSLVYAKSWLGRYIPGKIAWIGGKVLFGRKYESRTGVLAVTSVLEAAIQLITALALAFLLLAATGEVGRLGPTIRFLSFAAFALMLLSITPPVFNLLSSKLHELVKGRPLRPELRFSGSSFFRVIGLYLGIHSLAALPLFLLLKSIYPPLVMAHIPFITATFLLSGALGTLAVFAPSGLGVREGVLILLLSAVIPREIVLLGVIFLRFWSVLMDLLFYLMTAQLARRIRSPVGSSPETCVTRPSAG